MKGRLIVCYTDGSAVAQGPLKGRGGFGVYFPSFYGKPHGLSLGFTNTKTGRMELSALLYAIKEFHYNHKDKITLRVYSDSQYVVKSFTENRLEKWIKAGWRNSSGEVKNIDLWQKIVSELKMRPYMTLEMIWIKGHQLDKLKGDARKTALKNVHVIGNAMADRLADYKTHIKLRIDKS